MEGCFTGYAKDHIKPVTQKLDLRLCLDSRCPSCKNDLFGALGYKASLAKPGCEEHSFYCRFIGRFRYFACLWRMS